MFCYNPYIKLGLGSIIPEKNTANNQGFWSLSSGDSASTSTSSHFEASEGFAGTMALGRRGNAMARIQWVLMTGVDGALYVMIF